MRFSFTGIAKANGLETKMPYVKEGKTQSGLDYKTLNLSIEAAKNNRAVVELFGMNNSVIKTMDTDGNKIEISSDDRFDPEVVKTVANYKKNTVRIGDESKSFISAYDAVGYAADNIDAINGSKVTITGTTSLNVYQGNVSQRFTIQNIYPAKEDAKDQLRCTDVFYFNRDSFDTADWKETHKLTINGWVQAYVSEEKKTMYVPQTIIFDCSKIDWDNEKHVKLVSYKLKQIGCELNGDKIAVKVKKSIYKISVVLAYKNGAEEVPFDESMLTDNQKEAIELGLKSLDDFRPSGGVYGQRITSFNLVDFDLRGDYEDGYVDTELDDDEFEENIFKPAKPETLDDIMPKPKKAEEKADDDDSDDDDLSDMFG